MQILQAAIGRCAGISLSLSLSLCVPVSVCLSLQYLAHLPAAACGRGRGLSVTNSDVMLEMTFEFKAFKDNGCPPSCC